MAIAPTYNDIRAQKQAQTDIQNIQNQSTQTGQQIGTMIESAKNPMLAEYMQRQTQRGLGDINNGPQTPEQVALASGQAKIEAAMRGQLNPIAVLQDETIHPEQRMMLKNAIIASQNQQQTSRGLVG